MLLSREFLRLVGIALVVAIPLAYFAAGRWLEDFAYRIDLQPWTFAAAGATALLIAFLTVSLMGLRAAMTDPVITLRSE
jgi:putative ABC transport system permease protein